MEPDRPEDVHGIHRFEPAEVQPVMTEPTPTHTGDKGKVAKKGDEHFDVGAEQHYSHMRREHGYDHPYLGMPFPPPYPYGPNPYGPGYGFDYGTEDFYRHADPYAHSEHYNPYHHQKPPTVKGEAETHMGPDAAFFYKEMHDMPKPAAPAKKTAANSALDEHLGRELTPFEHSHPADLHHTQTSGGEDYRGIVSGEGHYAGSDHGAYAYHGGYNVDGSAHYSDHNVHGAAAYHGDDWATGHNVHGGAAYHGDEWATSHNVHGTGHHGDAWVSPRAGHHGD